MQATAHQPTAPRYSTFEADREQRLTSGSLLLDGQLEIVAEVACGGTSVVYHAIDHSHGGRRVALKVVNAGAPPAVADDRFRNEVRLMGSFAGHPHVVPVVAIGRLDGPPGFGGRQFLLTQLIEGVALDRVMGDHRRGLEWCRACTIARDVARALVDLHQLGIVHRDIKPGNILIAQGTTERAMLVDFGVAYATGDEWEARSPELTREGAPGTLLYMSPQQVDNERPAPSMDVYSFGIMLYELLSGNPPYHKLTAGEILTRKCDPDRLPFPIVKLCPELDRRITKVVDRCLHHEPATRPTATELLDTLDKVLGRPLARAASGPRLAPPVTPTLQPALVELPPVLSEPMTTPPVTLPPQQDHHRWIVAAGVVLAVVVVGARARLPARGAPTVGEETAARVAEPARSDAPADRPNTVAPKVASSPLRDLDPPPSKRQPGPMEGPAPTTAPTPSKPKSKQWLEKCPETILAAKEAAEGREWAHVLRLTKIDTCWKPHSSEERVRLRVQALFETLRYDECAKAGEGASAPDILRWAHICAEKKNQGDSP